MNKLLLCLLLSANLVTPLAAGPVTIGMAEGDLLKSNGTPQTKATLGKKSIYRWPDVQVILVDGKVESFQYRDEAAEKEYAKERAWAATGRTAEAKANAREFTQNAREEMTYARIDANAATRATEERLRRATSLSQQIRSIERQLSDDDKRSSFKGIPPMSSEARAYLNFRLDEMRSELANLR